MFGPAILGPPRADHLSPIVTRVADGVDNHAILNLGLLAADRDWLDGTVRPQFASTQEEMWPPMPTSVMLPRIITAGAPPIEGPPSIVVSSLPAANARRFRLRTLSSAKIRSDKVETPPWSWGCRNGSHEAAATKDEAEGQNRR